MSHKGPSITDMQLMQIEGCIRLALQKINRVRIADRELREVAEKPQQYSAIYRVSAEREGRHADSALTTALDELRDELAKLPLERRVAATWPVPQITEEIQS